MKRINRGSQRGFSLIGLIIIAVIVAAIGILGAQVFPTVTEYYSILRAVNKAKEGSTPADIRAIFDRQASIDYISSITSKDLDISKLDADTTVVAFAYQREIHLGGPAWLVLRYTGRSK